MQEIDHDGRDPLAVLHRRHNAFWKGRAGVLAAGQAPACERPVLGHDQRLGFGQVEHLARGMVRGHRGTEGRAAPAAGFGKMINRGIRCSGAAQCLAAMTFLPASLLARAFSQAADAGRLLQTVAGWRLAAVAAVQPKLALQLRHPGDQSCVLGAQFRDDRFISCRDRSVAVRSASAFGQCHGHLDSHRPVTGQWQIPASYLGSYD